MSQAAYQPFELAGGRTMVRAGAVELLRQVDAVVFDCDGTLIDVRRSYDATILKTVGIMVKGFSGLEVSLEGAGGELILEVRRTGGFNADWDTTYALSLFAEVAIEETGSSGGPGGRRMLARLQELVGDFGSRKRLAGHRSVDSFLAGAGLMTERLKEFRRFLGYPGNAKKSLLAATFDQIYYGGELFKKIYRMAPEVWYDEGLIEREKLFVGREDLDSFRRVTGGSKMAIATGRSFIAVKHTLGPLLRYFELEASTFIGDGDIYPKLRKALAKFRKPSGESLAKAHEFLSPKMMLYVGDSAEDRLMVDDVRKRYQNTLFAGIYGSSFNEAAQTSYFEGTRSDVLVKSLDQVPALLEMIRR